LFEVAHPAKYVKLILLRKKELLKLPNDLPSKMLEPDSCAAFGPCCLYCGTGRTFSCHHHRRTQAPGRKQANLPSPPPQSVIISHNTIHTTFHTTHAIYTFPTTRMRICEDSPHMPALLQISLLQILPWVRRRGIPGSGGIDTIFE
jgi:hypothetical protein